MKAAESSIILGVSANSDALKPENATAGTHSAMDTASHTSSILRPIRRAPAMSPAPALCPTRVVAATEPMPWVMPVRISTEFSTLTTLASFLPMLTSIELTIT